MAGAVLTLDLRGTENRQLGASRLTLGNVPESAGALRVDQEIQPGHSFRAVKGLRGRFANLDANHAQTNTSRSAATRRGTPSPGALRSRLDTPASRRKRAR
jgi:hypothetical protein